MTDQKTSDSIPLFAALATIIGITAFAYIWNMRDKNAPQKKKKMKGIVLLQDPEKRYPLPLIEKEEISSDTKRFRFGLPSKDHILGLPVGKHIHLIVTIKEELIVRAYTPVSSDDDKGYVDLVIKVYRPKEPQFPNGGKMSQYVDDMKIGDTIDFRGPSGALEYLGSGNFSVRKTRKDPPVSLSATHINMIAGGSGVTPMLQLVREVLKNPDDKSKMALIFANQTEADILLRDELEKYAKEYPDKFQVWYTLDRPPTDWKYSSGFINEEMIRDHLHKPSESTIVLMCGPRPMIQFACMPNLDKLGFDKKMIHVY